MSALHVIPQVPFTPYNQGPEALRFEDMLTQPLTKLITDAVYRLLVAYLDGNRKKNELYLSHYIAFFHSQVSSHAYGAAKVYLWQIMR